MMLIACLAMIACSVSAANNWKVLDTNLETFDTGIDFVSETVGYTAGDANGAGPDVYKTVDGGLTWTSLNASFGVDIMLLDIAAAGNSIVVSGVFGNYYSNNGGQSFAESKGEFGPSQSIRAFGVNGYINFGCAGDFIQKNGVSVSNNGGKTFNTQAIDLLFTTARYGVYPTANTWYITAGTWPESNDDYSSTGLRRFELQNEDGHFPSHYNLKAPEANDDAPANGYQAELVRTTDAGKTWTKVMASNNSYYFNGVDCDPTNANHCCATAEAFSIPNAGAHIFCTTDGVTWDEKFFMAQNGTHAFSLMDVRFSNSTYIWAAGAVVSSIPAAWFLRSDDGGDTWYQGSELLEGLTAMALTSPSTGVSYASVDNTVLQKAGVAKYTAK